MIEATRLHNSAMAYADRADRARAEGDRQSQMEALRAALRDERRALALVTVEPSRSILKKSAAYLAKELKQLEVQEQQP